MTERAPREADTIIATHINTLMNSIGPALRERRLQFLNKTMALTIAESILGVSCSSCQPGQTILYGSVDGQSGVHHAMSTFVPQDYEGAFCLTINGEGEGILVPEPSYKTSPLTDFYPRKIYPFFVFSFATNHFFCQLIRPTAGRIRRLPVELIANPHTQCATGCKGCSRGLVGGFGERNYSIDSHVAEVKREFEDLFPGVPKSELRLIHITTGTQPSEAQEVEMILQVIGAYRRSGFVDAGFEIYTSIVTDRLEMRRLKDAGVTAFVATPEVVNDSVRTRYWGKKGRIQWEQYKRILDDALGIFGRGNVEANIVLGLDPYQDMMRGIDDLGRMGVVCVGSPQRVYNREGLLDRTQNDVFLMGLNYFLNAFEGILSGNRRIRPAKPTRLMAARYLLKKEGLTGVSPEIIARIEEGTATEEDLSLTPVIFRKIM